MGVLVELYHKDYPVADWLYFYAVFGKIFVFVTVIAYQLHTMCNIAYFNAKMFFRCFDVSACNTFCHRFFNILPSQNSRLPCHSNSAPFTAHSVFRRILLSVIIH